MKYSGDSTRKINFSYFSYLEHFNTLNGKRGVLLQKQSALVLQNQIHCNLTYEISK